jgi:hypothetical protein
VWRRELGKARYPIGCGKIVDEVNKRRRVHGTCRTSDVDPVV